MTTYPLPSNVAQYIDAMGRPTPDYYRWLKQVDRYGTAPVQSLPSGGMTGQVLEKASATDGDAIWHTLVKGDVGLGNVDNTNDLGKPVSTATQTALDLKADIADLGAYQPLDSDLTAIAALASTGYAKRTGTNTWSLSTTIPNGDLNNSSMTLGGKSVSLGGSLEMNTIAFSGSLSADQTGNTVSAWNKVNLPTPATDIYSGWDGTNKRYKPPAGVYMFICNVSMDVATGSYGGCAVYLNGVAVQKNLVAAGAAIPNDVQVVAVLNMNGTTDYVEPYAFVSGSAKIYTTSGIPTLQAIRLL